MATTLQIMFLEKNGEFSIRKALAVMSGLLFFIACIASLFQFPELPASYIGIIASVFLFYFAKNRISGDASKPAVVKPETAVTPVSGN